MPLVHSSRDEWALAAGARNALRKRAQAFWGKIERRASDHPNLLDQESAIELARWGGVLSICDWNPDVSTTLSRGNAMEFLAKLNGLIPAYPCHSGSTAADLPDSGPLQDSS